MKLTALRGGDGDGVAHAAFGRPLDLTVDRTDLPPTLGVPAGGGEFHRTSSVERGGADLGPQNLSARVTTRLAPGAYWVRLYSGDQLRREFGLRVE